MSGLFGGHREPNRRAIEGSANRYSNGRSEQPRQSSSSAPIITVPDDEDDEVIIDEVTSNSKRNYNPYLNSGPTIREVSDEEAEAVERNKRRKGPFGKFFNGSDR